jgi:molecular chaperone GrpE
VEKENQEARDVSSVSPDDGGISEESQVTALTAERDRLATEKADLYDRLLRRQAEFENFRRRAERERSEFLQFASMELVGSLVPILDDLERALKVETADKEYAKGVELIYQRLLDQLKRMGLEHVHAAGQPFDPNFHEAVDRVHTDEVPDQSVLEEFQKGYTFKGKLLRPAMVKVAVKP